MTPATTPMQLQLDFLLAYIGTVLVIFVLMMIAEILVKLWLWYGRDGNK